MTGVVEQEGASVLQGDAFFQQVFVDINDAAARKNLVELISLQLVVTGSAAHHHRLDVQVVQRVGNPVEQHPVVGDHLLGLVKLARATLRVAATQVARWQHGLHAGVPQHGLSGQTDLAEQTLRTAAGKIKHRLGLGRRGPGVTDDRYVIFVFDVQQGAGGLFGQATGQLLVHEVNDLFLDGCCAQGRGRRLGLLARNHLQHIGGQALRLHGDVHHG